MIAIPAIYFTLLCIYFVWKHKSFEVSAFLAALYALTSYFAIAMWHLDIREVASVLNYQVPWDATIVYCGLLSLTFIPFSRMDSEKIIRITPPPMKLFNIFSWMCIGAFFITILFFGPMVLEQLRHGDWVDIRSKVYHQEAFLHFTGIQYVLYLITAIFLRCEPIILVLFFYSMCFLKKTWWFNSLLFLSSTMPIFFSFLQGNRAEIVFWGLQVVVFFLFFLHLLPPQRRHLIITWCIGIGIFVISIFLAITFSRWNDKELVYEQFITYIGEPFPQFCNWYENYVHLGNYWGKLFPLICKICGIDMDLGTYQDMIETYTGMRPYTFSTFLGTMLVDIGKVGMFIYVLLYTFFTTLSLQRSNNQILPFYQLLIYSVCIYVPLTGVFFYAGYLLTIRYWITFFLCALCIMYDYKINKKML